MAHSSRPRASLRAGVGLAKTPMPRAVFLPCSVVAVVAVVGRGGNPVFAGVGAFPAMRGMFKRPSAALPAGGESSEGAVFLRSCPGVPTSAQGDVFLPWRGARATGKLHERQPCDGFTQGAACPSFPAEDFRAGGPRTRRGRAGRQRSSAQVVRGRFVTDGQPRLRRGTGHPALKLPGGCSALP